MKKLFNKRMVALLLTMAMAFSTLAFTAAAVYEPILDLDATCLKMKIEVEDSSDKMTIYYSPEGAALADFMEPGSAIPTSDDVYNYIIEAASEAETGGGEFSPVKDGAVDLSKTKEEILRGYYQYRLDQFVEGYIDEGKLTDEGKEIAEEFLAFGKYPKGAVIGLQWNSGKTYWFKSDALSLLDTDEYGAVAVAEASINFAKNGIYKGVKAINYVEPVTPKPNNTPEPSSGDDEIAVLAVVGGVVTLSVGGALLYMTVPAFQNMLSALWLKLKGYAVSFAGILA